MVTTGESQHSNLRHEADSSAPPRQPAVIIKTIMTPNILSVDMDASLETIREIFRKNQFNHLPVAEDGRLMGLITDYDVKEAISPYVDSSAETARDRETLNRKAHQVMERCVVTICQSSTVAEGLRLLLENDLTCLLVLSEENMLAGIVTWKDFLRAFLQQQTTAA